MTRFPIFATCSAALACLAAPASAAPDGKVAGLNEAVFTTFAKIKKRNPGAFTEVDAKELGAAIMADGLIDPAERDLLEELTQSQFRSITTTPPGVTLPSDRKVMSYPVSGNAKKRLQDVLNPPLDLSGAWGRGAEGWNEITAEYRKSQTQEARVVSFVQDRVLEAWNQSNMGNGYKPLRDLIGRYYGYSNSLGGDAATGRTILYKACNGADRSNNDQIPDFIYNWVRPDGYSERSGG